MSNQVSAQEVKQLRETTGAGFMECKKALTESAGDQEKAAQLLRKWGVQTTAKKAGRATGQGIIGSYVHTDGKLGVLVEVCCETDFVAKNEQFQSFVKDLCLHVTAMNPLALAPEDLDPAVLEKEREIIAEQDDIKSKPENIQEKIIEGRLKKFLAEVCLLQQPFVKDDKRTVQELLTEQIATIGENISIGRFVRLKLGEN